VLKAAGPKYLVVGAALLGLLFFGVVFAWTMGGWGGGSLFGEPEVETATLKVTSIPPAADIYVAGETAPRKAPFEVELPVGKGYIPLRAVMEGYQMANVQVLLQPGKVSQHDFVLEQEPQEMGIITLSVFPPNARVTVDNAEAQGDQGTYTLTLLAGKTHLVKVEHEGYAPKEQAISVSADVSKEVQILLDLLPEQGFLPVTSPGLPLPQGGVPGQ
jgi:hypothetical protein